MNFKKRVNGSWTDTPHYIHNTSTDTLTTLPADIYVNDTTATVGLKGNMSQTGTPTPQNPIQPSECGDLETVGEKAGQYKIPISSASTTTPVYLGEVESTRRIRKKVLDGTETTWTSTIVQGRMNFNWKTGSQNPTGAYVLCTHYKSEYAVREGVCFITSNNVSFIDSRFQSLDDFKNFLADEYAAGHPVTVWYVDANPPTGVVNEPIRKIGDYADTVSGITIPTIAGANTLSVGTTLQPSEVTVNYKGWHTGAVHERDSGQWQ